MFSAYTGLIYIGKEIETYRTRLLFPVPFTNYRLWFKVWILNLAFPFKKQAIEKIIRSGDMYLSIDYYALPNLRSRVWEEKVNDIHSIKLLLKKRHSDRLGRLTVYSSVDDSEIGDLQHAINISRHGIKMPQHSEQRENEKSEIGMIMSGSNLIGWAGFKGERIKKFLQWKDAQTLSEIKNMAVRYARGK